LPVLDGSSLSQQFILTSLRFEGIKLARVQLK